MRLGGKHQLENACSIFRRLRIPYRNHIIVDLLQFLLGRLQGVGRRIELVGLEALIGKIDSEGLILLLKQEITPVS